MTHAVRGVWCATLSPLNETNCLDAVRLAAHVRHLFASGVDGIALFGTTGEGQSFSLIERREGLEDLLAAGIDKRRIMVATGCAALPETIDLTCHAIESGCESALVVPPFFFKDVSAEAVYASYSRVIDAVADPRLRLFLYHIPKVSGVAIPIEAIERLVAAYPGTIAGVKDSDGNLQHTRTLLSRFPELAILVGHEPHLPAALSAGGAGTICGIANLFPQLMRRLYDGALAGDDRGDLALIERFIALVERFPLFAAFKALKAHLSGDSGWEALRLPLIALDADARRAWLDAVRGLGIDFQRDGARFTERAQDRSRRL